MTVLGKTLVFFNLVFSIITGALVLMVFSARTNWQVAAKKFESELQVAQASVQAYQKEANDTRSAADGRVETVAKELKATQEQLAQAVARQKADDDKYQKEVQKVAQADATITSITTDRDRSAEEVKILAKQKDGMQKRINELVKETSNLHDARVNAEIDAKSLKTRNEQLVNNLKNMEKTIQELRVKGGSGGGTNVASENPPPENVEGLVKKVDATSGLITLSIGSDSGLAKGHTLEVYRLEPSAKYLAKVRIMEVWPHAAVAKPVSRPLGTIQEGDHAASKILGGG
jgi:myosin heavy subunit